MKKYKFTDLFGQAWSALKENYWLWVLGALLSSIVPIILSIISYFYVLSSWTNNTIFTFNFVLVSLTLIFTSMLSSILLGKKYFLTLTRQAMLVKKHLSKAVVYSLTDGLGRRFYYTLLTFLIQMLLSLPICMYIIYFFPNLGWKTILAGFVWLILLSPLLILGLTALSFLVNSYLFLFPYIIQDTCSSDNQLKPLSYIGCFRKSFQLIEGQKKYSFLLQVVQLAIMGVVNQVPLYLTNFLHVDSLVIQIAVLIIPVFSSTPYIAALEAIWAERLMRGDWEIVDFGV